jgi:hypothetical protein
MLSLSFRPKDIITLLVAISAAVAIQLVSSDRGMPLRAAPFAAVAIVVASVLIDAYYNAKRISRQAELAAYNSATPLSSLRGRVIRELIVSRRELANLRSEADELKVANAISLLDRESMLAVLRAASRPTKQQIWADQVVGFMLGVAGSILASYAYSALQAGNA